LERRSGLPLTALSAHTLLKIWVATEASRRFSADRQSGALELLLSTPLPVGSIVRGQTMALERQFALPICAVLLADFIFLLNMRNDGTWVLFWIAMMVVLVADVVTLSWVGMWRGLNSRRPNRAAALAVLQVMVLPWLVFGLTLTFIGLTGTFRNAFFNRAGPDFVILLGLGIALGIDALFGLPTRRQLLNDFRTVATTRFETKRPDGV
jgi:ABC-type transport system involved in cytochrome c biogenesis permease component